MKAVQLLFLLFLGFLVWKMVAGIWESYWNIPVVSIYPDKTIAYIDYKDSRVYPPAGSMDYPREYIPQHIGRSFDE